MKALLFDTETSGLVMNRTLKLDHQEEVIEFYGCVADLITGEVHEELDTLIKPSRKIDETGKAFKAVGLTNEMLMSAPPFAVMAPQIKSLIENAPLVLAHNASFDRDMIDIEFERLGQKIIWPPCRCTIEQTIYIKGYRLSLTDLHEYLFEVEFKGAHRAKVDVQALLRCCIELHRRDVI